MTKARHMTRRGFLGRLAALGGAGAAATSLSSLGLMGALGAGRAAAADLGGGYRALVCIFLYGGNDSFNMIVPRDPTGYAGYAGPRRGLAVPQGSVLPLHPPGHLDPLGREFGLHPSLAALHPLFETEGRLGVVLNAGTLRAPLTKAQYRSGQVAVPPAIGSHDDQQVQWQAPGSFDRDLGLTGWHGRLADLMYGANSGLGTFTNISLAGDNVIQVGESVLPFSVSGSSLDLPISRYAGSALEGRLRDGVSRLLFASPHVLANAYGQVKDRALVANAALAQALAGSAAPTGFPNTRLGNQLSTVAQIMAVAPQIGIQRQTFFCAMGGFDTHSNQNDSQPGLLQELAEGLRAFYDHTVAAGMADQVTSFTASEFGRTFAMNASLGTDHAWGGHQFVLGGAVNGDLYGVMPDLAIEGPDDIGTGRFIPTTAVDQIAATLALWFGVSPAELPLVTPNIGNFATADLGFMAG